jgi:hypothetical protein
MVLSADEIEILEYLKSWKGSYVSLVEVCRSAGGRQRFKDSPNWANPFMSRLVEANLAEGNDRGHFRYVEQEIAAAPVTASATPQNDTAIVGDDYFPTTAAPEVASAAPQNDVAIVGDDYFPTTASDDEEQKRWIAPHIAEILRNAGKKFGGQQA